MSIGNRIGIVTEILFRSLVLPARAASLISVIRRSEILISIFVRLTGSVVRARFERSSAALPLRLRDGIAAERDEQNGSYDLVTLSHLR